jgi:flagellar hook-length control protein FliK
MNLPIQLSSRFQQAIEIAVFPIPARRLQRYWRNISSREAFVSVTVGFSQATTSLIVPAPGTTKPDGTPAEGAAQGGGEAGLFAALLAMLAPGAQAAADDAVAAVTADAPAVAALNTILPPADEPAAPVAPEAPVLPDLAELPKSFEGKALLKDFTDALKAAKAALDEGKPLDPALEKKLKETVDAIAAWFAGQPQLQPAPVDLSKLTELATGSTILTAAPSGDLPEAPALAPAEGEPVAAPTDTPEIPAPGAASTGTVVEKMVQAQPVPAQLAELGDALKEFAAQLDNTSPDLAKALGQLADRLSVGDIADDAMAQLGLTRSLGSTSPELDQLVAALTAKPETKTTAATPAAPIATPVLDIPEVLAGQAVAASVSPEVKAEARKAEVPQPEAAKPEAKATESKQPEPLSRTAEVKVDTDVKLDTHAVKPKDDTIVADAKPAAPASPNAKPDAPAAASTTAPDAAAQGAQAAAAAATATRAIHAAYAAPVQQLNIPQVAFEVVRQFEAGNTKFQIRLDPADLGRIDVKLDLDKNGTVNAHMFVERPETLDLMMRDQRALQQALQQAGLDTSKTNLEFSLRQNPFAGSGGDMGQGGGNGGRPGFGSFGTPVPDESTELAAQTLYRGSASASGVNLFV